MAKQIIRTLSETNARAIPEVIRRVMGDGGSTAITPYDSGGIGYYFVIDSRTEGALSVYDYTGKLYKTADTTTPISTVAVKGRNVYEARNTSSVKAGWSIGSGSPYTGIDPAPLAVAFPVIGRQKFGGVFFYLFSHRNDPKFDCASFSASGGTP